MKLDIKIQLWVLLVLAVVSCTKGTGNIEDLNKEDESLTSYTKNVLIMEFVSFDCVYCPNVTTQLEEASAKYPGRIDVVSVHGQLEEADPMEFSGYKAFQNYFYGITGYPGVILDQRDDLVTVGTFDATSSDFLGRLNASTSIGIAISSTVGDDNIAKVELQVSNQGKSSGDYRLAVALIEDDVAYKQADLVDGAKQWIEDYKHTHVLRALLSDSYFGDPIDTLDAGGLYSKTFTYTIPEAYNKDKLTVVAYVIEASGFSSRVSVNSRSIELGKSIDF